MILILACLAFVTSVTTGRDDVTQSPVIGTPVVAVVQSWQTVAVVVGCLLLLVLGFVGIGALLWRYLRRKRPEKPMTSRGYDAYLLAIADSHKRLAFWTSIINSNELTPEFSPLGKAVAHRSQQTELEIDEIAEEINTSEERQVSPVRCDPAQQTKLHMAACVYSVKSELL